MITKTEKLLNKKMNIKEAKQTAKELYKHYETQNDEIKTQWKNSEKLSDEYFTYGRKYSAITDLRIQLLTIATAQRRSRKMRLDLENAVYTAENAGVTLI